MARAILTAADFEQTPIPNGLVGWWAGTRASVPAAWTVPASLANGRFPKAAATAGTQAGTATHVHNVAAHSHTLGSSGSWDSSKWDQDGTYHSRPHSHAANNSASAALDAASHEPGHVQFIPIAFNLVSGGTRGRLRLADLAADAMPPYRIIGGFEGASVPTGWALCDGSTVRGVVTPNFTGKFLRGIPTTGTAPGTSYAGNANHLHTANHYHALTGGGTNLGSQNATDWTYSPGTHTHSVTTATMNSDATTVEPLSHTIKYIMFVGYGRTTGQAADSAGLVRGADLNPNLLAPRGLTLAAVALADIASGWSHCDGGVWANGAPTGHGANRSDLRSRFIKHVIDGATDGGTVGGSDTHPHAGGAHTHSTGGDDSGSSPQDGTAQSYASPGHTHTLGAITWVGNVGGYSTNAVNHLPAYTEVAFIVRD